MENWHGCRNILCVRPDNMGDLLMNEPAIRALKETFACKISVLTSSAGAAIASYISAIDDVIIFDTAWVKSDHAADKESFFEIVNLLKKKQFDASVIFTVYSQNALPSAMLLWLAGIPRRLAYCRENPYHLLTHWVPDEEPYRFVKHQVRRDLDLVRHVGATVKDNSLKLSIPERGDDVLKKLQIAGIDLSKPWMILHPGVSEDKRKYPEEKWIAAGKKIIAELGYQLVITGSTIEKELTDRIGNVIGEHAFSCAGWFTLDEFIVLIKQAPLVISVNTATIHIAAATHTRVAVLYALTNPQHSPWKTEGKILPFSISETQQSKNEVLHYTQQRFFGKHIPYPDADDILEATRSLLWGDKEFTIPELITSALMTEQEKFDHGINITLNFNDP